MFSRPLVSQRLGYGVDSHRGTAVGSDGWRAGLGFAALMIRALPSIPFGVGDVVRQFPGLGLSPKIVSYGLGVALLLGLLAGLIPALLAYRARITEVLRQV